jgi:Na+-transporting NADH:ubiquinone oxidoreductase subunit NqrB
VEPTDIDPRLFQMAALGGLLAVGITQFGLEASVAQLCVTGAAALATQAFATKAFPTKAGAGRRGGWAIDWRSPVISSLSLTLLLRTHDPLIWAGSGALAIGSKFAIRVRGKHLFNPACCAIVTLLLGTHAVWVSPGQWGALAWDAAALGLAAMLVLSRAGRVDMAGFFLLAWGGLLAARCVWLGDPWAIPLHQMQSGALLVFAFFMITDPRSTPDSRAGRLVFAVAVAVLAHMLQFGWQIRQGLYCALMTVAFFTPLLDAVLPARRFIWAPRLLEV